MHGSGALFFENFSKSRLKMYKSAMEESQVQSGIAYPVLTIFTYSWFHTKNMVPCKSVVSYKNHDNMFVELDNKKNKFNVLNIL